MTYSEEDVLLAALPEPHRTAVQLGLETGIRLQSEGLSLTWPNVHLDQARALIAAEHAKNGRERWIHLSPDMVTRLRTMQAGSTSAYVFAAPGGGPLHRFKHVYFQTVRAVGLAGTGLNIHALRHTWASRFQEATGDLVLLQALGGWSSLSMVSRYAHHRPERVADATAKMLAARDAQRSPRAQPLGRSRGCCEMRDLRDGNPPPGRSQENYPARPASGATGATTSSSRTAARYRITTRDPLPAHLARRQLQQGAECRVS